MFLRTPPGGFDDWFWGASFGGVTGMPARAKGKLTRVIIADDHASFREGLRMLLELEGDVKVVAEVERADHLGAVLAKTPCDILLLDLNLERSVVRDIEMLSRVT